MNEEVKLKNGVMAERAVYRTQVIKEFENPLIECLNVLPSDKEKVKLLSNYPEYSNKERNYDKNSRILLTSRINDYFQPLPETIEVLNMMDFIIKNGYKNRNPFSPKIASIHQNIYGEMQGYQQNIMDSIGAAQGCAIIGVSGAGKSSTLLRCLQIFYPPVIVHSEYKGKIFSTYQLPFLYVYMSKDGSVKGLFYAILERCDFLLGSNQIDKAKNDTADILLLKVKATLLNCNCGCLIIDELQHLSLQKSGGEKRILNIFHNLSDIGIPVVTSGTSQSIQVLLGSGFRQVRRSVASGGVILFERIVEKRKWQLLLKGIWKYQWCEKNVELTEELSDCLFDLTIGLPSLLKALYIAVQKYVISSGKEYFDKDTIIEVFNKQFQMAIPAVKAFRSGILKEMIKYEDLYIPHDQVQVLSAYENEDRRRSAIKLKSETAKLNSDLVNEPNINKKVEQTVITDDIRYILKTERKGDEDNYSILKECGIICNPLIDEVMGVI